MLSTLYVAAAVACIKTIALLSVLCPDVLYGLLYYCSRRYTYIKGGIHTGLLIHYRTFLNDINDQYKQNTKQRI